MFPVRYGLDFHILFRGISHFRRINRPTAGLLNVVNFQILLQLLDTKSGTKIFMLRKSIIYLRFSQPRICW
jgi:hypothetical protein